MIGSQEDDTELDWTVCTGYMALSPKRVKCKEPCLCLLYLQLSPTAEPNWYCKPSHIVRYLVGVYGADAKTGDKLLKITPPKPKAKRSSRSSPKANNNNANKKKPVKKPIKNPSPHKNPTPKSISKKRKQPAENSRKTSRKLATDSEQDDDIQVLSDIASGEEDDEDSEEIDEIDDVVDDDDGGDEEEERIVHKGKR